MRQITDIPTIRKVEADDLSGGAFGHILMHKLSSDLRFRRLTIRAPRVLPGAIRAPLEQRADLPYKYRWTRPAGAPPAPRRGAETAPYPSAPEPRHRPRHPLQPS
jgi:hypothetical protein